MTVVNHKCTTQLMFDKVKNLSTSDVVKEKPRSISNLSYLYSCVLLMTGSFNPVHPLHFNNFQRVREYLENEHQPPWNVLAGYISPTQYVIFSPFLLF